MRAFFFEQESAGQTVLVCSSVSLMTSLQLFIRLSPLRFAFFIIGRVCPKTCHSHFRTYNPVISPQFQELPEDPKFYKNSFSLRFEGFLSSHFFCLFFADCCKALPSLLLSPSRSPTIFWIVSLLPFTSRKTVFRSYLLDFRFRLSIHRFHAGSHFQSQLYIPSKLN